MCGEPVADATVCAAPCGRVAPRDGPRSVAACDADGRFTVELQRAAPHWLWIDHWNFEPWCSWHSAPDRYAPGTRDVVIHAHNVNTTQLHVVDARTGARVEEASVLVVYDYGPLPPGVRVAEAEHPDSDPFTSEGIIRTQPEDGFCVVVIPPARTAVVRAAGYATALAHFTDAAEHTLALELLGSLRGSVAFADGTPHACWVDVRRAPTGTRLDADAPFPNAGVDEQGEFVVRALAPALYDVFVARLDGPRRLVRGGVRVLPGEVTELGRIDVEVSTADVTLRVKAPAGVDARALLRELALSIDGVGVELDTPEDGETVLRNLHTLPARTAQCTFPARSGALAPLQRWMLTLAPGSANDFTLDLGALALCPVDVHVDRTALGGRKLVLVYGDDSEQEHEIDSPQGEPFVEPVIARGGGRLVVEHVTLLGEAVATSEPIELPRTSVTPIEVHVR